MHVSVATRLHRSLGHGLHESARLNEKLAIDTRFVEVNSVGYEENQLINFPVLCNC